MAGKKNGKGIGMLEGFSWEDFGILVIFHFVPTQSSFIASNTYVREGLVAKNRGSSKEALEIFLQAWRANPENDEALKEILRIVQTIDKPDIYIKVAKQASKLKRPKIAKNLLNICIEKNPNPQQIKEIEIIQKDIEFKEKKFKNKELRDKGFNNKEF